MKRLPAELDPTPQGNTAAAAVTTAAIPTLSTWLLLALAGALVIIGALRRCI